MEDLHGTRTPVDQAASIIREPELPKAVTLRPITAKDEEGPAMPQQGSSRKKTKVTLKQSRDEKIMGVRTTGVPITGQL